MVAGSTTRVSADTAGGDSNSFSFEPSISADGRHVAFTSYASNLVPGDVNTTGGDVYVRDLVSGITTRATFNRDGGDPNGDCDGNRKTDVFRRRLG